MVGSGRGTVPLAEPAAAQAPRVLQVLMPNGR